MTKKNITVAYIHISNELLTEHKMHEINLYLLSGRVYTLYNISIKITSTAGVSL